MPHKTPAAILLPTPSAPSAPRWIDPPCAAAVESSSGTEVTEDTDVAKASEVSEIPDLADVTEVPDVTEISTEVAEVPGTTEVATEVAVKVAPEVVKVAEAQAKPAPPLAPGRIRRVLGLDGLRGIAVLAVVIYHFFDSALPGGFLGVDIFFVLSGFLITSLLIREVGATGTISLKEFWRRRARRILPAAVTVLLVTIAIAGFIGGDVQVALVPQFLGSLFFANNWVQIAQSHSYFTDTTPQLFTHYWSLAIEEQFYVLWPVLFLGLFWLGRRRFRLITVIAFALGAASFAAMVLLYDPQADPSRVYFGTDTHAFGLLGGALLALIVTSASPEARDSWPALSPPVAGTGAPENAISRRRRFAAACAWILSTAAFLGLGALLVLLPDTSPVTYRGGLLGASILSIILIMTVLRDRGPVAWILRLRPLRYFGERSFSLYLWHWPVVVFLRYKIDAPGSTILGSDTPHWVVGVLALIISLGLSEASYRWVENPLRRRGYRAVLQAMASPKMLVVPVVILTTTLLAGVALGGSPAKSELERQLDELAAAQRSAPPSPPATAPTTGLPKGSEITGIGDSVMLSATRALQARFPGITIDAAVSRHYSGGESTIQTMIANNTMGRYVVLGFGTNGQAFDGELDKIRSMLGPNRIMILVVPYGGTEGIHAAADQVIDYAAATPNVYLAPWCQLALSHPTDLGGDGVHPDEQGQQRYADAVEAALTQAVAGRQDSSISCRM